MHTDDPVVADDPPEALAALVESVFASEAPRLERLAGLLLGDWAAGQDLVQDVFERAHATWSRNGLPDSAAAYLRTGVVNATRSHLKRQLLGRRREAMSESAPMVSAEAVALLHAEQRRVVLALGSLPPRQRACLVLRFYLDLSDRQVAAALAISLGTAKTHLRRGLAAMRRRLED